MTDLSTFPRGPFGAIIVDPPWRYTQRLGRGESVGDSTRGGLPYESMPVEEIKSLPIGQVASRDCALVLWTTNTFLPDAFEVLKAYGFTYKVALTWVKDRIGLGYWLRGQTEHALLAVKGNPRRKFTGPHGAMGSKVWSTALHAPRREHSQKPGEVWVMVEDLFDGPYLELFARHHRQGWTAWGNQVPVWTQNTLRDAVQVPLDADRGSVGEPH